MKAILSAGEINVQAIKWLLDSNIFSLIVNNPKEFRAEDLLNISKSIVSRVSLEQKKGVNCLYQLLIEKILAEENPVALQCLNIFSKLPGLEHYGGIKKSFFVPTPPPLLSKEEKTRVESNKDKGQSFFRPLANKEVTTEFSLPKVLGLS